MSQAFIKEGDDQWLHDIAPTLNALINFLTRENNGIGVYPKENSFDDKLKREVYKMRNGLSYFINEEGKWEVIDE